MKDKLISIDIRADFGFLKKPDINEGIYLTYNMLHKPALLGILGAIIGLEGYHTKNKLPEYYTILSDLKIAIQPLGSEKGNYGKTVIQYNNGVGYASFETGGNLLIKEQTLIKPAYRCFILLKSENSYHQQIDDYLKNSEAEYLPYLGKNDFSLWWENWQEYEFENYNESREFKVQSVFMKNDETIKDPAQKMAFIPGIMNPAEPVFVYFEELPIGFNPALMQYTTRQFVYTNFMLKKESKIEGLYQLKGQNELIQLF
jgi:CRISPR-associated protein Cas5h